MPGWGRDRRMVAAMAGRLTAPVAFVLGAGGAAFVWPGIGVTAITENEMCEQLVGCHAVGTADSGGYGG